MKFFLFLPKRQKILIGITLVIGLFLTVYSLSKPILPDGINTSILLYGLCLPFLLFTSSAIIDLNTDKTLLTWLALATVLLLISIWTGHSQKFIITRSSKFNQSEGINSYICDHSTSSLKALFFFLIVYWILNVILKKTTGNYIVSTYRQSKWFNNDANRKITGLDVSINIVLLLTIIISSLFGH